MAGNNNLVSPIPEQRENELLMLHEQIHFNLSAEAYPQEKAQEITSHSKAVLEVYSTNKFVG